MNDDDDDDDNITVTTGAVLDRIYIFVVSNPSILPIWQLLISL